MVAAATLFSELTEIMANSIKTKCKIRVQFSFREITTEGILVHLLCTYSVQGLKPHRI